MKLIVNVNVLITNKDDILLLDEIIAKYGIEVENVAVNVEAFKDSPMKQTQLPTQQSVQTQPVQTQPVQTAVPVVEKAYTLEDLQRASSTLVQAGKIQLLQGLLQEFNSLALTTLPVDQYGAFALRLRELGAAI